MAPRGESAFEVLAHTALAEDPQLDIAQKLHGDTATSASPTLCDDFEKQSIVVETLHHDLEKGPAAAIDTTPIEEAAKDHFLVDWDGLDDPAKPLNWSSRKKWTNMMIIAALTLLTPFESSMFAPGVPMMMKEFHSTSTSLASFTVSIYVLGYTAGPLVIAPLSELYGRTIIYHSCTFLFLIFTILCAVSVDLNMIIAMRFLTGLAGSCPLTIGSGTIADCFRQEERGKVMSLWTLPILLGPTLGPVVGGYLSEALGWRWNFWFLTIWTGIMLVLCIFSMPETYPPTLLLRKAKKLRKKTGDMRYKAPSELTGESPGHLFKRSILRPMKLLFLSPIVFALSLYISLVYGYLYIMFSTMTEVFESVYGISSSNVGLTFLGLGVGQFLGLCLFGSLSDKTLKAKTKANGGEAKPEYRLPFMLYTGWLAPAGLFVYGWSAQYHVHWIVPIIGTSMLAGGLICIFMPIGTYLVDAYTVYAASAMAANTVLRSLGGAVLPLAGRSLYDKLGLGWGNSLLGFVALAFLPVIWLLTRYAEYLRTSPRFKIEL